MMSKQQAQPFKKKYQHEYKDTHAHTKHHHPYFTPSKYQTIQSKNTMEADTSHPHFSVQSSRIADQAQQVTIQTANQDLLDQLQRVQWQANKLLQRKERENYFLSVQLQNYEVRLQECQQANISQRDQIARLRNQIQIILTENNELTNQNQCLQSSLSKTSIKHRKLQQQVQSLNLIKEQSLKKIHQSEYWSQQSSYNVHNLKRQVQDLRLMVAEMEENIRNCPTCFLLRRDNQELNQAYSNLQRIHNDVRQKQQKHEKDLLQNITVKIQENQNIIRENLELKQKRPNSNSMKMGRQKFKESVAKRCRTLTDQY